MTKNKSILKKWYFWLSLILATLLSISGFTFGTTIGVIFYAIFLVSYIGASLLIYFNHKIIAWIIYILIPIISYIVLFTIAMMAFANAWS